MDLSNVVKLGERMDRPKSVTVRLPSADYWRLVDYCDAVNCSREAFVRGIILTFFNQFGDLMERTAAEHAPDQEVPE